MGNKILSERAKKIVDEISEYIKKNENINCDNYIYPDSLKKIFSNLERIKKEFESEMFFLVVAGAIKSGKSTLINLLANKRVSTTKQGRETTLKPAIICKGEEDIILLFNTSKTIMNEENNSSINDLAIDFIKGLIDEKTLNEEHKIQINRKKFTDENISKYLTQKCIEGEEEPKLVNIQIKVDEKMSSLEKNIAIIDTPGIDGILAGAEGLREENILNATKHELMSRVDLMLFLQSSVTPINSESAKYVDSLAKEYSLTNMSLVHNKFTLKPWRKEDNSKENSDEKAKEQAKEIFKKNIKDLKTHIVDFAKAEDGYAYEDDILIKDSKFEEFKEDLFKNIKINKHKLMEDRVINSLEKLIEENLNKNEGATLKSLKLKIKELEEELKTDEENLVSKIELIQNFFKNNKKVITLIDIAMNEEIQEKDDGWELKETLKNVKDNDVKIVISKKDKDSEILRKIENECERIHKQMSRELDSVDKFNKFVLSSKPIKDGVNIENLLNQFNDIRHDIQIDNFELKIDIEENCKKIEIEPTKILNDVKTFWNHINLFNMNDKQIQDAQNALRKEIIKESENMVKKFSEILKEEIKEQFDNYYKELENKKEEVRAKLKEIKKEEIIKLNSTKKTVQEVEDFFKKLKNNIKHH